MVCDWGTVGILLYAGPSPRTDILGSQGRRIEAGDCRASLLWDIGRVQLEGVASAADVEPILGTPEGR